MSAVLLDTHALVWLMADDAALGRRSGELAEEARTTGELFVSAVSFWELAMLSARGRVTLDRPVRAWRHSVLALGIDEVPLSGNLGILATELEGFPADPADRMIAATAMEAGATLVTADASILAWTGQLIRHNART